MNRQQRLASKANGRRMMKQGWAPFQDITLDARSRGVKCPDGIKRIFLNPLYIIQEFDRTSEWGTVTLLMVRRNDEAPVRSWGDMQRIKNEIAGPDRVAVEVYPAEADLVDQANMYHLWVLPAGFTLPFGLHLKARSFADAVADEICGTPISGTDPIQRST